MTIIELCSSLPRKTTAAGEIILQEGKTAGVLYVLAEGAVEIMKGDFQITTVTEPGSFFGEVSVLLGIPHMATVRTLEPSAFHVADDPLAFLHARPQVA